MRGENYAHIWRWAVCPTAAELVETFDVVVVAAAVQGR